MTDERLSTTVDGLLPGEPEKITVPAEAVSDLIQAAIRSPEGNAWWRGFVAAHGYPSWVVQGTWRLEARECAILPGVPEQQMAVGRNGSIQTVGPKRG